MRLRARKTLKVQRYRAADRPLGLLRLYICMQWEETGRARKCLLLNRVPSKLKRSRPGCMHAAPEWVRRLAFLFAVLSTRGMASMEMAECKVASDGSPAQGGPGRTRTVPDGGLGTNGHMVVPAISAWPARCKSQLQHRRGRSLLRRWLHGQENKHWGSHGVSGRYLCGCPNTRVTGEGSETEQPLF